MVKKLEKNPRPIAIRQTYSLCPVCLERVSAQYIKKGKEIFLEKQCMKHGFFSTVVWRGHLDFKGWQGEELVTEKKLNSNCPRACGICESHLQGTCCVVLEVTKRCNLNCHFCFAEGNSAFNEVTDEKQREIGTSQCLAKEPSLEELTAQLKKLAVPGKTLVQLSGGEPTLREDLPEIVLAAKEAGCKFVQLNTNGIRLAEDIGLVKKLAEAGLSFVFLQFDGTEDEIYKKLRGRNLLELKKKAITNCGAYNIGVTLVPTIVPGVNVRNIGELLRFAIELSPIVRGLHFQPASFFGRIPEPPKDEMRVTLDELLHEITLQSEGLIKEENLSPSCCDHPLCGFHGDFVVTPELGLKALSQRKKDSIRGCCDSIAADKNRSFVARRWQREALEENLLYDGKKNLVGKKLPENQSEKADMQDLEYFLKRVKSHGFTITSMVFQDGGNIDLKRLRQCSLHVFKDNKFIPFCAYYLTGWSI